MFAPTSCFSLRSSRQQERKRRDYLCERRSRSRGRSGSCSTTFLDGPSNSLTSPRSRPSSACQSLEYSVGSEMTGGGESRGEEEDCEYQEGDDDSPFDSAKSSIATRVNARRPSTTAAGKAAPRSRWQEHFDGTDTASLDPLAADPPDDRQPQPLISLTPIPRHPGRYHVSSSMDGISSSNIVATKEGTTANDFQPDTQAASMTAMTATTRRTRNGGQAVAAAAAAAAAIPSSRVLSPLLDADEGAIPSLSARSFDGVSVGSCPSQLGNTTPAATAARACFVGEGAAAIDHLAINRHPRHRRRYSSLSFAENPHATTAEMIRRYRGQLGRHSISSQHPRATTGAATALITDKPPRWPVSDRRRWSDTSTSWHYYAPTKVAVGSGPAHRPRTSVGGRRWSQDVRFQQQAVGRARLAPTTRTAGGRWGAKHGRLEALVPGEESARPSTSILYRIPRESGPWVLDSNANLHLLRKSEHHSPYS